MKQLQKHFKQQISSIVSKIRIESDSIYWVGEQKTHVLNAKAHNHFFGDLEDFGSNDLNGEGEKWLNQHLSASIYSYFYTGTAKLASIMSLPPQKERDEFMNELSAANQTKVSWDNGWTVYHLDPSGNAHASKNNELRWLQPNSWKYSNPATTTLALNVAVDFAVKKEDRGLQTVFYYVHSQHYFSHSSEIVRIYWSLLPEGAAPLIEQITSLFNSYKIPFQFKCLNHPDLFDRTDSAVLYLDKRNLHTALFLVKEIAHQLKPKLRKELPLFTYPLHQGVGLAEDPGNQQSFGMSRSQIIAEALVKAYKSEKNGQKEKEEMVEKQFLAKGVAIDEIYLHHHSNPEFVIDLLPS